MDKKKIIELIDQMSSELRKDDGLLSEPMAEQSEAVESRAMMAADVNGLVCNCNEAGEPKNGLPPIVSNQEPLCFILNYEKFLAKNKYKKENVSTCHLHLYGKTRSDHRIFMIFASNGEVAGTLETIGGTYKSIDLLDLYNRFGDASFKMTGLLDIIYDAYVSVNGTMFKCNFRDKAKLDILYIDKRPDKLFYQNGEQFDKTGMAIKAYFNNGDIETIFDYTMDSDGVLKDGDEFLTFSYMGASVKQRIYVGEQEYYNPPSCGEEGEKGVFLDTLGDDFIKVTAINGKLPMNTGEIELPGCFDVEVNFVGLLKSRGLKFEQSTDYCLRIFGKLKNGNIRCCTVNEYMSDKVIAKLGGVNNMYTIPLRRVFEETGSANFRINIDHRDSGGYPHEVFTFKKCDFIAETSSVDYLKITAPPTKTRYIAGEKFDATGLKVEAYYTFGTHREITNYTLSPSSPLTGSDGFITVSHNFKTQRIPINVMGQHVSLNIVQYIRKKTNGVWGEWSTDTTSSDIIVSNDGNTERKTVVTLDKSLIQSTKKDKTGLKLYISYAYSKYETKHIKVNGLTTSLDYNNYFYIGNVKTGETGNLVAEFEYSDVDISLSAGTNPTVYYCNALDPAVQGQKKNFELADGVSCEVDLLHGSYMLAIKCLGASVSPLGMDLFHIYSSENPVTFSYDSFKLNLYERLELSNMFDGPEATPVYTDASGNNFTFTVLYSVTVDGEVKYLNSEGLKSLNRGADGKLYFNGLLVSVSYIRVQGYRFLTSLEQTILNNVKYKELASNSNSKNILPQHWIKADNLYKGFDKLGRLSLVIDEFDNYVQLNYNNDGKIEFVEDSSGNRTDFTYYNGKLSEISNSRGDRVTISGLTYRDEKIYEFYSNGQKFRRLTFKFESVRVNYYNTYLLSSINDSANSTVADIKYDTNSLDFKIKEISTYSTVDTEDDNYKNLGKLSSYVFKYDNLKTTISDEYCNGEVYSFDSDGILTSYINVFKNKVINAEFYEYTPYEKQIKKTALNECLNVYDYDDFMVLLVKPNGDDMIKFRESETLLNKYNMPVKVIENQVPVAEDFTKTVVTEYEYDDTFKTVKETTTETFPNHDSFKYVTEYLYDENTQLPVKSVKTSYKVVNGNAIKEFTDVEECEYDGNGCVCLTKQYRYRGDSSAYSDVFYAQKTYDKNKLLLAEYDESGLHQSRYEYHNKSKLISKVTVPGNRVLNYAYDNSDRLLKLWGTSSGVENANTVTYKFGETDTLNHSGDNAIQYVYGVKHRPAEIKIDGNTYESYEYNENVTANFNRGDMVNVYNANGEKFRAVADYYGTYEAAFYNDNKILERCFDVYGRMLKIYDFITGARSTLEYDLCGNMLEFKEVIGHTEYKENYTYDWRGNVTDVVYSGTVRRVDKFVYNDNSLRNLININTGVYKVEFPNTVDSRYKGKKVYIGTNAVYKEQVDYVKENDRATHMPKQIKYNASSIVDYTYDGCGNITEIRKNGVLIARYAYDNLNRLIREDNSEFGESYFYSYDNNGNILAKETCAYTVGDHIMGTANVISYIYDKDRMIKFGNEECTYDKVGNPTVYRGKNAEWTMGRKLKSFNGNSFEYDAQGRRIKKNTKTFVYDSNGRLLKQSDGLEFFYDTTGLLGVSYDGENYVYRKDIQGNITAILDSNGQIVVNYYYDAWGNCKALDNDGNEVTEGVGAKNPFRYRSYYYDTETKLYYLHTRYYDPETGRFINADNIDYADPETINGLNLYAYCGNNPVMNIDPSGHFFIGLIIAAAIAGAVIGATVCGVEAYKQGKDGWDVAGAALVGGVVGAAVGAVSAAIGGAGAAFIGAVAGAGVAGTAGAAAVSLGGAQALAGGALIAGVLGLNVWFSRNKNNNISMDGGEPNSVVGKGHSEGIYDNNGHLIYRRDYGFHAGANPHTHYFKWYLHNGIWRFIEEIFLF